MLNATLAADVEVPQGFGPYSLGRELGRGASGRVFTCSRRGQYGEGKQYAAKAIDLRRLRLSARAERELKKLGREIDILRRVPAHENLVRFIDSHQEQNWCFLVLEFVSGGDLFSTLLRRQPRPLFSEVETVFVLRQLVEGLDFLHSHDVIHRDLKLENVLVVNEAREGDQMMCTVKITDFGLSKVVGGNRSLACSTVGSPRYIAPEVLAVRQTHDFRADLWSLGVLLYLLLAGRFPFEGQPVFPQQTLDSAVGKLGISDACKEVVLGLLQLDRAKRLPLQAVREHALLSVYYTDSDEPVLAKRPRVMQEPQETSFAEESLFGTEDLPLLVSEDSVKIALPAEPGTNGDGMPHFSPIYLNSQDSTQGGDAEALVEQSPAILPGAGEAAAGTPTVDLIAD